jgi:hypothetical protein
VLFSLSSSLIERAFFVRHALVAAARGRGDSSYDSDALKERRGLRQNTTGMLFQG